MANEDLLLVFTNPAEGREDEFNKWYEETHVPDVLAVPGVESAQRYQLAPIETPELEDAPNPEPPGHLYLAAYSLSRDGNQVMQEFIERLGNGQMSLSDAMDFATVGLSVWRPIGGPRIA